MEPIARLGRFALPLAVLALVGCSSNSSSPNTGGGGDGGPARDASTEASVDAPALNDTSTSDVTPGPEAGPPSSTCPASGDPVACDDGTGSLGTKTACPLATVATATSSYHLEVSGSKFATSGACFYVTPSACPTTSGDVLQFSGSGGTGTTDALDGTLDKAPYCFRMLDVVWDTDWEDDGMTTGGPVGMGGDMLAASQKPQALIAWAHEFERTSPTTAFCARGGSGGSSELLYQLMHDNGGALLDHVQIVSATPFGRIDKGCDPNSPQEGTNVVCSALPATTEPQYNAAAPLVRGITHDPNCDSMDGGTLAPAERAALEAMSLAPSGFAAMTLPTTSLSVYMCSNAPNATQGQAVDVFGVHADLAVADAGPYTGLISLKLASPFYGCAAGTACTPHIVCGADCMGEGYGATAADKMELLADLQKNCVVRH